MAVYGVDPKLDKSQWFDAINAVRQGEAVDESGGGKITNVNDVADALAYAVGDESTAGEIYNLAEMYLHWCEPPMMAAELAGGGAKVVDHRGDGGATNRYDESKAVAFFNRHGNADGLRRGREGVRRYVGELLDVLGGRDG